MNLLIIGAGGHGAVVKEIAELSGRYEKIDFIDDNLKPGAVGPIANLDQYVNEYEECIVSLGNNQLREALLEKVVNLGYKVPVLIHPRSYVSPTASISAGTVIEANAGVNSNSRIGRGVLISLGASIDHNAVVEDYAHIDCGAVVNTNATVSKGSHLESCSVARSGVVTSAVGSYAYSDMDDSWVRKYISEFGDEPSFF